MRAISALFFASFIHAYSLSVEAASFDCAKASTRIDNAICASAQVSKLDNELDQAYKSALARSTEPEVFRAAQRSWLIQARNRCQDEACLIREYTERNAQLTMLAGSHQAPSQTDNERLSLQQNNLKGNLSVSPSSDSVVERKLEIRNSDQHGSAKSTPELKKPFALQGIGEGLAECPQRGLLHQRCTYAGNDVNEIWAPLTQVATGPDKRSELLVTGISHDTKVPIAGVRIECFGSDGSSGSERVNQQQFDIVFYNGEDNYLGRYAIYKFKEHPIVLNAQGNRLAKASERIPVTGTKWEGARSVTCRTMYVVLPSQEEVDAIGIARREFMERLPVDNSDPIAELWEKFSTMGPRCPAIVKRTAITNMSRIEELRSLPYAPQKEAARNLAKQTTMYLSSSGCISR